MDLRGRTSQETLKTTHKELNLYDPILLIIRKMKLDMVIWGGNETRRGE